MACRVRQVTKMKNGNWIQLCTPYVIWTNSSHLNDPWHEHFTAIDCSLRLPFIMFGGSMTRDSRMKMRNFLCTNPFLQLFALIMTTWDCWIFWKWTDTNRTSELSISVCFCHSWSRYSSSDSGNINTRFKLSKTVNYHELIPKYDCDRRGETSIRDVSYQPKTPSTCVWHHRRQVMHACPTYIMSTQIRRTTSKLEHEIGPYNNTIRNISHWWQPSGILQSAMLTSMFWEDTFFIRFYNLLLRLFHTFGCKQTLSKMLTDYSAFATLGDAHREHSINSPNGWKPWRV